MRRAALEALLAVAALLVLVPAATFAQEGQIAGIGVFCNPGVNGFNVGDPGSPIATSRVWNTRTAGAT